jgi:hypothetical protein
MKRIHTHFAQPFDTAETWGAWTCRGHSVALRMAASFREADFHSESDRNAIDHVKIIGGMGIIRAAARFSVQATQPSGSRCYPRQRGRRAADRADFSNQGGADGKSVAGIGRKRASFEPWESQGEGKLTPRVAR